MSGNALLMKLAQMDPNQLSPMEKVALKGVLKGMGTAGKKLLNKVRTVGKAAPLKTPTRGFELLGKGTARQAQGPKWLASMGGKAPTGGTTKSMFHPSAGKAGLPAPATQQASVVSKMQQPASTAVGPPKDVWAAYRAKGGFQGGKAVIKPAAKPTVTPAQAPAASGDVSNWNLTSGGGGSGLSATGAMPTGMSATGAMPTGATSGLPSIRGKGLTPAQYRARIAEIHNINAAMRDMSALSKANPTMHARHVARQAGGGTVRVPEVIPISQLPKHAPNSIPGGRVYAGRNAAGGLEPSTVVWKNAQVKYAHMLHRLRSRHISVK